MSLNSDGRITLGSVDLTSEEDAPVIVIPTATTESKNDDPISQRDKDQIDYFELQITDRLTENVMPSPPKITVTDSAHDKVNQSFGGQSRDCTKNTAATENWTITEKNKKNDNKDWVFQATTPNLLM